MVVRILQGHVLETLAQLPAESCQVCVPRLTPERPGRLSAGDASASVRRATAADLAWIKPLADQHRVELGFVHRAVLAAGINRGELLVISDVAFLHFHQRRDGWHTVYELVSERPGCGRALLKSLPRPVRLKCPVGLPANGFYLHMGGEFVSVMNGWRRQLNIWEWRV